MLDDIRRDHKYKEGEKNVKREGLSMDVVIDPYSGGIYIVNLIIWEPGYGREERMGR